ncbi:hypothetical protein [Arenimonas metalli]|uniref:hypothetical protein n=1 Tax=Arenimonas metalli TaxID=948077 RepID=UPI0012EC61EA|nr:hypothetical protein [Arenimonas metalli]
MSRGIERSVVPPVVIAGMAKAAKSWNALHGTWASRAPEYWFTVTVAQELQRKLDDQKKWIRLEGSVLQTMSSSGPAVVGRPVSSLRRKGRCDIVIERANESPFAAIEIKTRAYAFTAGIRSDVVRLRELLCRGGKNSLSVVCLASYSDASEKDSLNGAKARLERRFENFVERATELCVGKQLRVESRELIRRGDESGDLWGVQCLTLLRR